MTSSLGTVMIVDDEDIDQRQYKRILERSGMVQKLLQFTYADEALAWLENHPDHDVDLIFLDVNIPRMDGFEFLQAIGERLPGMDTTVIVMLTTSLSHTDRDRALSHPQVKGFFNKPLQTEHLLTASKLIVAS
jgi:CheY-like chemotaxis protein